MESAGVETQQSQTGSAPHAPGMYPLDASAQYQGIQDNQQLVRRLQSIDQKKDYSSLCNVEPPRLQHAQEGRMPGSGVYIRSELAEEGQFLMETRLTIQSRGSHCHTTTVSVPSSEHVAEIVGRQGCKIKALRARTGTYIKTPLRGEQPSFVITGRLDGVLLAAREIVESATHFTQIRQASRSLRFTAVDVNRRAICNGASQENGAAASPNDQAQTVYPFTMRFLVNHHVIGLLVGPRGSTIKKIQIDTDTYILTPSRHGAPEFEIRGHHPRKIMEAVHLMEEHIKSRTGRTPPFLLPSSTLTVGGARVNLSANGLPSVAYQDQQANHMNMFHSLGSLVDIPTSQRNYVPTVAHSRPPNQPTLPMSFGQEAGAPRNGPPLSGAEAVQFGIRKHTRSQPQYALDKAVDSVLPLSYSIDPLLDFGLSEPEFPYESCDQRLPSSPSLPRANGAAFSESACADPKEFGIIGKHPSKSLQQEERGPCHADREAVDGASSLVTETAMRHYGHLALPRCGIRDAADHRCASFDGTYEDLMGLESDVWSRPSPTSGDCRPSPVGGNSPRPSTI